MLTALWQAPAQAFAAVQQTLFEGLVQPLMFQLGLANHLESAFDGTGWILIGAIQLVVMLVFFSALERWRPADAPGSPVLGVPERWSRRTDVIYTLVHKFGVLRIALFFSLDPLFDQLFHHARLLGWQGWQLDQVWPGVTDIAVISLVLYLLVFDLVDYGMHRAQHHWQWWWQLHALHHSQQRMTMWSDQRNHLLDDVIRSSVMVVVAQLIGVGPGQFVLIVALTQLLESLSHANVRLWFGALGERILVSPRFHRLHHSIGLGHESHGPGSLGGHNYAVLFPIWDLLFRTANFELRYDPTGIRDQLPTEGARDYGSGFWRQQWLGLKRLVGAA